jgi:hypothetical protein
VDVILKFVIDIIVTLVIGITNFIIEAALKVIRGRKHGHNLWREEQMGQGARGRRGVSLAFGVMITP